MEGLLRDIRYAVRWAKFTITGHGIICITRRWVIRIGTRHVRTRLSHGLRSGCREVRRCVHAKRELGRSES
jgi:hypothetical protein